MKNTDVKSDQKAKPGSLQRFSLGITFIINLSELENSSVNLFVSYRRFLLAACFWADWNAVSRFLAVSISFCWRFDEGLSPLS